MQSELLQGRSPERSVWQPSWASHRDSSLIDEHALAADVQLPDFASQGVAIRMDGSPPSEGTSRARSQADSDKTKAAKSP